MNRRNALKSMALASAGLLLSRISFAQPSFPNGPIRMIVAFAAGGPADVLARIFGNYFSKHIGVAVVVENKNGAGGIIGAEQVIRSEPSGQTLIFHSSSSALYSAITRKPMPYDPVASFAPVGLVSLVPFVLAVGAKSPFNTLKELIAYAKKNPGKLSYGSAGLGSSTNVTGELFKTRAGDLDILHVPYKGSAPAIVDTMGGSIAFTLDTFSTMLNLHNEKRLKILAVFADKRSEVAPDIPTAKELGVDMNGNTFNLVSAPRDTPAKIVDRLAQALHATMQEPELIEKMKGLGIEPVTDSTPDSTRAFLREQVTIMSKVIEKSNIYVS